MRNVDWPEIACISSSAAMVFLTRATDGHKQNRSIAGGQTHTRQIALTRGLLKEDTSFGYWHDRDSLWKWYV